MQKCIIFAEYGSLKNYFRFFKNRKLRDHCHYAGKYRDAAYSICNLKFNAPNDIHVVFHRGSNYDYHFIIKESANGFKWEFERIGENKEKVFLFQ